jgi:proteasome lid subunit RPN8/RPN11
VPVRLPAAVRDRIVEEARAARPRECCGLLAGRGGDGWTVEAAFPLPNVAEDPLGFRADAGAQTAARAAIDAAGLDWIGTYHSHPFDVAAPSPRDVEAAPPERDAPAVHLIVSLLAPDAPKLAAWRYVGDREVREEVRVV